MAASVTVKYVFVLTFVARAIADHGGFIGMGQGGSLYSRDFDFDCNAPSSESSPANDTPVVPDPPAEDLKPPVQLVGYNDYMTQTDFGELVGHTEEDVTAKPREQPEPILNYMIGAGYSNSLFAEFPLPEGTKLEL